jgi:hypothetical protein
MRWTRKPVCLLVVGVADPRNSANADKDGDNHYYHTHCQYPYGNVFPVTEQVDEVVYEPADGGNRTSRVYTSKVLQDRGTGQTEPKRWPLHTLSKYSDCTVEPVTHLGKEGIDCEVQKSAKQLVSY